jgi:tetratricopeptide (TPR) repeat protein
MTAEELLDEIDRVHDDEPQRAAAALRSLDAAMLPAGRLPLAAFLLLHVIGEKLGSWAEAADLLEALRRGRDDAPLAVLAHAAAAAQLAGRSPNPALDVLAATGGATEARTLVDLSVLGWRPPADNREFAAELERLANESQRIDPNGPLNQRLATGFNNTTSALLDRATAPVATAIAPALRAGADAALRFWKAAGTWVNHERALYLRALVGNRVGDFAPARDDCRQALAIIAANGAENVDRAFLLLQLAAALLRLGERAEGQATLDEARGAAAAWNDDGLRAWFRQEHDRMFATEENS